MATNKTQVQDQTRPKQLTACFSSGNFTLLALTESSCEVSECQLPSLGVKDFSSMQMADQPRPRPRPYHSLPSPSPPSPSVSTVHTTALLTVTVTAHSPPPPYLSVPLRRKNSTDWGHYSSSSCGHSRPHPPPSPAAAVHWLLSGQDCFKWHVFGMETSF